MPDLPERLLPFYFLNPMAAIMTIWRGIFYSPQPEWKLYLPALLISGAVFLFGRLVFLKMQPFFAEKM